jgi:membrane-bound ClpP family serine protease
MHEAGDAILGSMQYVIAAAGTVQGGDDSSWLLLCAFLLMAASIVLFVLELFIPSGGLLALLCLVSVVGSLVAFFKYSTAWGVTAFSTYCLLAPIALIFGVRLWSHSPFAKHLILGGPDDLHDEGTLEAAAASEQARRERVAALRGLVGARGRTATPLRPVGVVVIDGRRIDALAEGGAIDAGVSVIVVEIVDNQVKVRPEAH